MRWLALLLLIILPASAYIYNMPVEFEARLNPEVLMPGDSGVLTLMLANGAAVYGTGNENPGGERMVVSTPVDNISLKGTEDIAVTSEDYSDLGSIGAGDRVTLYYTVAAAKNISDGNYFLKLESLCGYGPEMICRNIPIKVDSAYLQLSRAAASDRKTINLQVANPRGNEVNAVTIIPSGEDVVFSPQEYYIGRMEPDEVFTISFSPSRPDGTPIAQPLNLSFISRFKNGDTWHESEPYSFVYNPPAEPSGYENLWPALIILPMLAAGGYILWKRKGKRS